MKRILCSFAIVAVLISCVKEQHAGKPGQSSVIAESEDFDLGEFLTKATDGSSVPSFPWGSGDKIGVIPMDGNVIQADFEIVKHGAAPKAATFECSVLELQKGGNYAAFYPISETAVRDGDLLEFYFEGQKQRENDSYAHIRDYNYMYASTVATSDNEASFQFKHLVSLIRLQLTVPHTDVFRKLTIEASDEWFARKVELSLKKGTVTSTLDHETCNVTLDNIPAHSGEKLIVWIAVHPTTALDGEPVTVRLIGDKTVSSAEIPDFGEIEAGKAYSFDCAPTINEETEYGEVDLGLSVKWGTCNLGASSPEEFGDYYSWAEVETKASYSLDYYNSYKAEFISESGIRKEQNGYVKYVPQNKAESYGFRRFYDDKTVLEADDDIARVTLKGKWRMPRKDEFDELIANCKCEWVSYRGVNGTKFTSKVEGYEDKWIFLPAAGYCNETNLYNAGNYGSYWASTLYTVYPNYAYYLYLNSAYVYTLNYSRFYGQTIRPVSD